MTQKQSGPRKWRGTNAQRAYAAGQPQKNDQTVQIKYLSPVPRMGEAELQAAAIIDHLLTVLNAHANARTQVELSIRQAILKAVEAGATWKEIGESLGTSGQAAWERYRPGARALPTPGGAVGARELPFGFDHE